MGSFWQAVKETFAKVVNVLKGSNSEEGVLNLLSGKAAALSVGVLGFILLLLPVQSPQIMSVGDNLIRMSVVMWNGS